MELRYYLVALWRWAWLLILSTVLAAILSFVISSQLPRVYSATVTLMVGSVLQQTNPNQNDITTAQDLAQTYGLLVRRQPLLQAAADALAINIPSGALAGQVSAAGVPNSQLVTITVVDVVPERARLLADELAHQLILQSPSPSEKDQDRAQQFATQQLQTLQARITQADADLGSLQNRLAAETSARGVADIQGQISALQQKITSWQGTYASLLSNKAGRVNQLTVVEPAVVAPEAVSPNIPLNVSVAAAVGLVLATAAALILEYLDDTIKNKEGVERMLNLPALGVIGRMRAVHEPADRLVTMRDRTSAIAEAYRVVATNVQYARLRKAPGSLLVTSPGSREGKSTTLCNLGIALAQTGKRVIICDADLRRPSVHRYFGVGHEVGLTSLLLEERLPIEQALSQTQVPGLQILPSGPVPPNPVQLLASEPMRERLAELKQHCDVLLFDSPAAGSVADASILGALCDGVIVVVDARRTRSDAARQVVADLQQVRLTLLGVILNRARMRSHSVYFGQRHLPAPRASSRVGALLGGLLGGQR